MLVNKHRLFSSLPAGYVVPGAAAELFRAFHTVLWKLVYSPAVQGLSAKGQQDHSPPLASGAEVFALNPRRWSPLHQALCPAASRSLLRGKKPGVTTVHGKVPLLACHHSDRWLLCWVLGDGGAGMGLPRPRIPVGSGEIGLQVWLWRAEPRVSATQCHPA